jgi:hypothetical protein
MGIGAVAALFATGPGCDTVALGPPPADVNACRPNQQFFYERVWPEFLGKTFEGKSCGDTGCHDASSARVLVVPAPRSQPGLPLPPDWAAVYKSVTAQMSCTNVAASALLLRPASADHRGGKLIDPSGPEAAVVRAWVEAQ